MIGAEALVVHRLHAKFVDRAMAQDTLAPKANRYSADVRFYSR